MQFASCLRLLIIAGAAVLAGACSDGNDSNTTTTGVPDPTIEAADGSPTLLGTTSFDLGIVGYQQREFFISGKSRSFAETAPLQSDGKWSVRVADAADYKTRILVYRPIDPKKFNGTVIVEWLNVSGGTEASSMWIHAHNELIRGGYVWIGVSAQKAGIDGGGAMLAGLDLSLKAWNPTRYNSLLHPGDQYAYDIFSQATQAVRHAGSVDPLDGLHAERIFAAGESQSADFLVTYINALAPVANLFDAYLVHSRVHGTAGLTPKALSGSADVDFASRQTTFVRDDLKVPVFMLQTETDLFFLGEYPDRQDDAANFRLWEVAGAAHADLYVSKFGLSDLGNDPKIAAVVEDTPNPLLKCTNLANSGPQHFVLDAAMAALDNWVRNGIVPAHADRLEVAGNPPAFVKDNVGNVLGGVRTPYVDAPVAILSGELAEGSTLCRLFGSTKLLDSAELAQRYPDHASFVADVNASTDNAVSNGFLLPPDADLIKAWAQGSSIGTP
jgi:hypothetical protein